MCFQARSHHIEDFKSLSIKTIIRQLILLSSRLRLYIKLTLPRKVNDTRKYTMCTVETFQTKAVISLNKAI